MILPMPSVARFLPCFLTPALAVFLIGCPPGSDQGLSVIGIWRHEAGTLFSGQVDGEVWGLTLQEDGAAEVFTRDPDIGIVGNYAGSYSLTDTGLVAQFPRSRFPAAQLFTVNQPDPDRLELTNASGAASTFARIPSLPAELRRRTFDVVSSFTRELPPISSRSGLGFDYERLWYETNNPPMVCCVNPDTGRTTIGIPSATFHGYSHVHAMQGGHFWMLNDTNEARRYTPDGVLADIVRADSALGALVHIHSLAYDPSSQVLWLYGPDASSVGHLLRINSAVEPDRLLNRWVFNVDLESMAWDHGRDCLWALVGFAGQSVIQISVVGPSVAATYALPDTADEWEAIAVVGRNLFLAGRNATDDEGVLCEAAP